MVNISLMNLNLQAVIDNFGHFSLQIKLDYLQFVLHDSCAFT